MDTFKKYEKAGFDTLRQVEGIEGVDGKKLWICGFFCQGDKSMTGDGMICYLPKQDKTEFERSLYLSPLCDTPQNAIDTAYFFWNDAKKNERAG